jgi:ketosteroid isomerase-like protein
MLFVMQICIGFSQTKAELDIRKVLSNQTEAWNNGDLESFMHGYWKSDSLTFVGKDGITYGYQNTLNNYKKNYANKDQMGKLQFKLLHINKLSDEYYQVIGQWHLYRKIGDVSGHFTVIFRKIQNKWLMVSDHSS